MTEGSTHRTNLLRQADKKYLWHPFTPMRLWLEGDPLVIESGEGFYLVDTEGNRYIDGVSSLWCNVHGHKVPELDAAIQAQLGKIAHSTLLGLSCTPSIQLAERLVKLASPQGPLTRVFYSDSGSESVEIACKIAYQYWQNRGQTIRKRFIAFRNGYHGDTLGAVSLGGIELFQSLYHPLLFETIFVDSPCSHVHPEGGNAGVAVLKQIDSVLQTHAGEVCALIIEPLVQGAGGILTHPPGFLKAVRRLAQQYDVLLIADEVATGFGRTGTMFACEHEGISPDLMCLAKGLTGGYLPLAATLATEEIFDAFSGPDKTFYHGHTFTGNALACAVALASLDRFESHNLIRQARSKIDLVSRHLKEMELLPNVARSRQCGFMVGIDIVRKDGTNFDPARHMGAEVCMAARKRGVIIRPLGDTIVLMPAPGIDETTLDKLLSAVSATIKAMPE